VPPAAASAAGSAGAKQYEIAQQKVLKANGECDAYNSAGERGTPCHVARMAGAGGAERRRGGRSEAGSRGNVHAGFGMRENEERRTRVPKRGEATEAYRELLLT